MKSSDILSYISGNSVHVRSLTTLCYKIAVRVFEFSKDPAYEMSHVLCAGCAELSAVAPVTEYYQPPLSPYPRSLSTTPRHLDKGHSNSEP
jgi:hypothetical protein